MTDIANTECFEAWNGDSGRRWADEADRRDAVLAPVADVLLDAAQLQPGEHVLDIGCGCGVTTLAAGRAIGNHCLARGLDLSEPMLDVARRRADVAGLAHVEFVQGDAQTYQFPSAQFPSAQFPSACDVAISRFGTMFFADPTAALANIRRGIRRGGRVCFATWQPLAENDWLTVPGAALLRYGRLPDIAEGGSGMFGQSVADAVTNTLQAAGYDNIELMPVTVPMLLGTDADDATDYLARSGIGRAILETVPTERRPAALDAVRAALAEHVDDEGIRLGGAIWIIRAERVP